MVKSPFKIKSPFKGGSPFKGLRRRKSGQDSPGSSGNKAWMESAADRFYAERGGLDNAAATGAADARGESPVAGAAPTSVEQRWQQYKQAQASGSSAKPAKGGGSSAVWAGVKGLALLGGATLVAFLLAYRAALVGEEGRFAALDALMGREGLFGNLNIPAFTATTGSSSSSSTQEEEEQRRQQQKKAAAAAAAFAAGSAAIPCTIQRVKLSELALPLGAFDAPVVIEVDGAGAEGRNAAFRAMTARETLLWEHGDLEAKLTSGNSYSQGETYSTIAEYLEWLGNEAEWGSMAEGKLSSETQYLFGNHFGPAWENFLAQYERPPCSTCQAPDGALSFGVGGAGTGVSWHVHGPGYSEVLHGRKRWFLYPPAAEAVPGFHPNMSSLTWQTQVLPGLVEAGDESALPLTCDIGPGELLYFPHMWRHQIMNLEPYTVFVSTFTAE